MDRVEMDQLIDEAMQRHIRLYHSGNARSRASTRVATRSQPASDDEPKTLEEKNFELARRLYPGKKRGFRVEFENFKAKHRDWRELLDDDGLESCVQVLMDRQAYSPGFWPHFQTFVNQSRYEEALQPPEVKK